MRTALRISLAGAALAAAALAITSATAGARPDSLDDPTIVAIFDAANTWDVETGDLAAVRGKSADVREFGKMLSRDHKAVRQQGRDLAQKLGVTPTPPKDFGMAKDHAAAIASLKKLEGADFDMFAHRPTLTARDGLSILWRTARWRDRG